MINGALTVVLVFCALMLGGVAGAWAIWPTAYRHGYGEGESERHRHRLGDPVETTLLLPRAGRLPLEVMADPAELPTEAAWRFAGEPSEGWAAEYERLHQPEPLTDTGEMRALGDRVVAKLEGDTNEWIFTHLMRTSG